MRRCQAAESCGRSPRGERGLKSQFYKLFILKFLSLPTRGAWIEMYL